MARILIAGCGDIGTELGITLGAAGHEVWGLKRSRSALPAPMQVLSADLSIPSTLSTLPPHLDAVVYSAAAASYSAADYQSAYVDGVRNLLEALRHARQNLQKLLLVSSTSVYAQRDGEWVDEETPALADGFAGRNLRYGEQLVWDSVWPATVVRFGGIYGAGRTRLIESVCHGTAQLSAGNPTYTNRIHRDDCVRVLAHLLEQEQLERLYVAVDDAPAPLDEVLCWIADALGVSHPPRLAQPAIKPGAETRRDPATRLRSSKRCRNTRLRSSGFQFRYPSYREGYAALLGSL